MILTQYQKSILDEVKQAGGKKKYNGRLWTTAVKLKNLNLIDFEYDLIRTTLRGRYRIEITVILKEQVVL